MQQRPLGKTGIFVSALGLGTVKFGRDRGVKYPGAFKIPDDATARRLIGEALDLGINLIDTAPAYGIAEERLGGLLAGLRERIVLSTKTGEEFDGTGSTFDFTSAHTRMSVERSLRRMRTDRLDLVLIHSDGDDLRVLEREEVLGELFRLRTEGRVRAVGISTKTVEGGLRAVELGCDVVMVAYNPEATADAAVIDAAGRAGCGVLLKKALASGHAASVEEHLRFALAPPAVSSVVIGTIHPGHLRSNVAAADAVLGA